MLLRTTQRLFCRCAESPFGHYRGTTKAKKDPRVRLKERKAASRSPAIQAKYEKQRLAKQKSVDSVAEEEQEDDEELDISIEKAEFGTEMTEEESKQDLRDSGVAEEYVDQITSPDFMDLVNHFSEEQTELRKEAATVMFTNKYYRKFDLEVERKFGELNYHYRKENETITGDVFEKYQKDFDKVREDCQDKYLKKTKEYAARISFRKALVRKHKRNDVLEKLKSFEERQRFFATAIKWNWVTRKKYYEWRDLADPNVKEEDLTLHQRIKANMAQERLRKKRLKEKKKLERHPMYKGPFYYVNKLGYVDHPFYSEPSQLDAELATISNRK